MLNKENKDEIIEFLIDMIKTIDSKLYDIITPTCEHDYDDDDDFFDDYQPPCNKFKSMEDLKELCEKTLMEVVF